MRCQLLPSKSPNTSIEGLIPTPLNRLQQRTTIPRERKPYTPNSPDSTLSKGALSILRRLNDVIDFQDHFADLSSQEQLLLLAAKSLKDILLLHVIGAHVIAVNAQVWVILCNLPGLHLQQHPHPASAKFKMMAVETLSENGRSGAYTAWAFRAASAPEKSGSSSITVRAENGIYPLELHLLLTLGQHP